MKDLSLEEMESVNGGGIPWYKVAGCGALAAAAGLCVAETGPLALYVSDLTFGGCVATNWS